MSDRSLLLALRNFALNYFLRFGDDHTVQDRFAQLAMQWWWHPSRCFTLAIWAFLIFSAIVVCCRAVNETPLLAGCSLCYRPNSSKSPARKVRICSNTHSDLLVRLESFAGLPRSAGQPVSWPSASLEQSSSPRVVFLMRFLTRYCVSSLSAALGARQTHRCVCVARYRVFCFPRSSRIEFVREPFLIFPPLLVFSPCVLHLSRLHLVQFLRF